MKRPDNDSFHMSLDEFAENAKKAVDEIVAYYKNIESYPVLSKSEPGDVFSSLPGNAPEKGEQFDDIIRDVRDIILPGLTHWQSPMFFGYFPSNTSGPSIIGELISAGLGVQGMLWATSPACTELETRVLDWTAKMLGLPDAFMSSGTGGGVIQDSASSAALCAVIAAREQVKRTGMPQENGLAAYASEEAHSSVEKALRISGVDISRLRRVPVDETFAMRADALEAMIAEDLQKGIHPFFIAATLGTTSSNGIDPVPEIGPVAEKHHMWLHVDAAMSGTAAVCPEYRYINKGLHFADSYCFNPHKWMFTNFDCDCFYVKERKHLIQALSILPEYLRNEATESGRVFDYRDWQIPLGRRFRSLKLWFVIRHYGIEGLQYHIRKHIELAQYFAGFVRASDTFELAVEPPFNLVCFRYKGTDKENELLLKNVNKSGSMFMTHTRMDGKYTLRMCIGQTNTRQEHVYRAWHILEHAASVLQS